MTKQEFQLMFLKRRFDLYAEWLKEFKVSDEIAKSAEQVLKEADESYDGITRELAS